MLPSPMFPGSHSRDSSFLAVFLLQMVLLCLCLTEPPPQSHMSLKPRTSQYPTEVAMGATGVGRGLCSESSSQNVLALVTIVSTSPWSGGEQGTWHRARPQWTQGQPSGNYRWGTVGAQGAQGWLQSGGMVGAGLGMQWAQLYVQ